MLDEIEPWQFDEWAAVYVLELEEQEEQEQPQPQGNMVSPEEALLTLRGRMRHFDGSHR